MSSPDPSAQEQASRSDDSSNSSSPSPVVPSNPPPLSDDHPTEILIQPTKKKDPRLVGQRYNECGDGHIKCDAFTKERNFR